MRLCGFGAVADRKHDAQLIAGTVHAAKRRDLLFVFQNFSDPARAQSERVSRQQHIFRAGADGVCVLDGMITVR